MEFFQQNLKVRKTNILKYLVGEIVTFRMIYNYYNESYIMLPQLKFMVFTPFCAFLTYEDQNITVLIREEKYINLIQKD